MKRVRSLALIFVLSALPLYSVSAFVTPGLPLPLEQVIQPISTPDLLVRFMKNNFIFEEDRNIFGIEDYWQTPQEFWDRKTGDCEDYALFAHHVLRQNGIESYVVSFYGINQFAHTITVYVENGFYNVINEDRHYRYRAKSIEEAMTRVYYGWTWGAIAELKDSRGWMSKRLEHDFTPTASSYLSSIFSVFKIFTFIIPK